MSNDKMREEFEAHYAEEFSVVCGYKPSPEEMVSMRDGDSYGSDRGYLNGYWKGWQASREAVEVEISGYDSLLRALYDGVDINDVVEAIKAQGLRVKVSP